LHSRKLSYVDCDAPMKTILTLILLLLPTVALAQLQPIPVQGSNAAEGYHVFSGSIFSGITVSWQSNTTARYIMLFDATAIPSNGTTTQCTNKQFSGCLAWCAYLPESITAPNRFTLDWTIHPVPMRNGVVVALSSGAGCGTLAVDGSNDFFYSQVR
jgi:hypothetical protein